MSTSTREINSVNLFDIIEHSQPEPEAEIESNSSFSKKNPFLQLAIDSTSLGEFKTCPRKYKLSIIDGWRERSESVHLTFGILLHEGRGIYDVARAQGLTHDSAVEEALEFVLQKTWDRAKRRPWISEDPNKNRLTLIRTLVWYLDEWKEDIIETLILDNGKPAVEINFAFDSGYKSSQGEQFILCGYLDRIGRIENQIVIADIKTSKNELNGRWFANFSPDNQFSLYVLAGKVVFGKRISTIVVDGVQVLVGLSRFQRGLINRDDQTIDEWYKDLSYWLKLIEACAIEQNWPMNDKACGLYGGCQFRRICSKSPGSREMWLKAEYERRVWDPLKARA